jgi:phage N-6-adenine-methyltransferase
VLWSIPEGATVKGHAALLSSKSDEWETPDDLFNALNDEFKFDLDAAATFDNAKVGRYIGPDQDALSVSWRQMADARLFSPVVWLNPPYSRCREFIAKAALEATFGCTVVCLVPARTDTRWWHDYVWDQDRDRVRDGVEIRFLKGRVKFKPPGEMLPTLKNSATFPSVVIVFRPLEVVVWPRHDGGMSR